VAPLLAAARRLGLCVKGVSFHVGSGATNPDAFTEVNMRCCASMIFFSS